MTFVKSPTGFGPAVALFLNRRLASEGIHDLNTVTVALIDLNIENATWYRISVLAERPFSEVTSHFQCTDQ
jgi:hypothetical protein